MIPSSRGGARLLRPGRPPRARAREILRDAPRTGLPDRSPSRPLPALHPALQSLVPGRFAPLDDGRRRALHRDAGCGRARGWADPARAHPTMRKLILWHAIEEIEHKAVAFDVLRQAHPSYALRILGFAIAKLDVAGLDAARAAAAQSARRVGSREARRLGLLISRDNDFRMERALRAGIKAYLRRDFHPNDSDDLPLARARLIDIGLAAA